MLSLKALFSLALMTFGIGSDALGMDEEFKKKVKDLTKNFQASVIEVEDLSKLLQQKDFAKEYILVDVRESEEYAVSHISGAKFSSFKRFKLDKFFKDLKLKEEDRERLKEKKTFIFYCSVGYRSGVIAEKLLKSGYKVHNLFGGIFAWVNEGYPVVDQTGRETKKIHTYDKNWSRWSKRGEKVF